MRELYFLVNKNQQAIVNIGVLILRQLTMYWSLVIRTCSKKSVIPSTLEFDAE